MRIASWNVRGFNNPLKHNEVKEYLWNNNLDLVAILEIRVNTYKNWDSFCNYDKHYNGRIWVLFNPKTVAISHRHIEAQDISCKVHHYESNKDFCVSFIYGSNDADQREDLWAHLRLTAASVPWIVLGDFNVVRCPEEKLSPNPPILQEMVSFNSFLSDCQLDDIVCSGCDMTWTNKQESGTRVWSKLDRVLVNPLWLSSFPSSFAHFQEAGLSDHSPEEKDCLSAYNNLKNTELQILHQKVKIKHIQLSDCGTQYFHTKIAERQHQQVIGIIQDKNGVSHQGIDNVALAFQHYYQSLLGQETDVDSLITNISYDEIKDAIFGMDSNSSPGVDGFSAGFFKSAWSIIKHDFCKAILSFIGTGRMCKTIDPSLVVQFFYKTVSKILANRLQKVLPSIIGEEQAAFVKGRSIHENILLSQALVKGYNKKSISPRCLIKVDIRKAFDSSQWSFISDMLKEFGFPQQFIKWIQGCITGTWFSLKLNGGLHGFFPGKSGVRQEDPLSPYIFVLSMEILSRFLRQLCKQPQVSFHPKCCKLNLTHLIFADDLMVFIRGDVPSVRAIKGALNDFSMISGLTATVDETSIYFGGVSQAVQEAILADTGFSTGSFPFRYLGLPLGPSRYSITMFDSLFLKVQNKVQHWSAKLLTYAGKLHLLNVVLFGIENFWCSSALLPKEVIIKLTQLSRNFFSGIPQGGFNTKNIRIWNIALQLHWLWKLSTGSESLWAQWHQAYSLKQHTIWDVDSNDYYSSSLKGILLARDIFFAKAGSVHTAEILLSSWLSGNTLQTNSIYEYLLDISDQDAWTSTLFHPRIVPTHRIISILAI
ncbi:uncharacterized protein LOC141607600 [Silene latifolia]|uniref:uncharacterized protein LOC141607600 n=1 Tax=Silene latifolia TaxID=37657 RepID=UPI003D77C63B